MKLLYLSLPAVLASLTLNAQVPFTPLDTESDVKKIIHFFTSPSESGGGTYLGTAGALQDRILPYSYFSTADYWGKYVAQIPGNNCTVTDVYNSNDYTLSPAQGSPGANLQIERVNVFNGTDIYDAATWQIALALASNDGMLGPNDVSLFTIADNQNQLLHLGYDGKANSPFTAGANRALSPPKGAFTYNGKSITTPDNAYFFRMVTTSWLSTDPFMGTPYQHYITAVNLPPNPDYQAGKITWQDWKPITGENAWGFLIGPLQLAYQQDKVYYKKAYVPHDCTAVQNALNVLNAFAYMQSPLGAVYYATKGSLGNTGNQPVKPYEVSVENNASLLAGLSIFKEILTEELNLEPNLTPQNKAQLQAAVQTITTMIEGGTTPQGYKTAGILSFFKNNAWDAHNGILYQGGLANSPDTGVDWKPTVEPKAVDVSTWGVTVIGQPLIDNWYGFGTAYIIWHNIKNWGGFYGPDQQLWGVGYSDQDGNGTHGDYNKGILSAEWTAGAINMVRALMVQYTTAQTSKNYTPAQQQVAAQYVKALATDEQSMVTHLASLRSDNYPSTVAYQAVRPANYSTLISLPSDSLAYMYASKRYPIPFGWLANPLPSAASTGWAVMLHYNYNPFTLGGTYTPSFLP